MSILERLIESLTKSQTYQADPRVRQRIDELIAEARARVDEIEVDRKLEEI